MPLHLLALFALVFLPGCQSKFMYFPRPYGAGDVTRWQAKTHGITVHAQTRDGTQEAFLLLPAHRAPERLWIVCSGNGTLALEWSDWMRAHGPANDAFLLMDYPAYGACAGQPNPASIRRSAAALVPAAFAELGWTMDRDRARLRFFGHSLGGAAALIAASEFDIRRGVLVSTFSTMMDMACHLTGLPVGFLIFDRYNNIARLHELEKKDGSEVFVFHGANDEVIPVAFAQKLQAAAPSAVHLQIVPGGRHNTLRDTTPGPIAAAMREARR